MTTAVITEDAGRSDSACAVCLDSVGTEVVFGNCGRTCASTVAYHAHCHAEMRNRCRLECAICRVRSSTNGVDAPHIDDDDRGWLMFDNADGLDGTVRMTLVLLVAFVLSPPLLLVRMLLLRVYG
jgi:hypothetical protein